MPTTLDEKIETLSTALVKLELTLKPFERQIRTLRFYTNLYLHGYIFISIVPLSFYFFFMDKMPFLTNFFFCFFCIFFIFHISHSLKMATVYYHIAFFKEYLFSNKQFDKKEKQRIRQYKNFITAERKLEIEEITPALDNFNEQLKEELSLVELQSSIDNYLDKVKGKNFSTLIKDTDWLKSNASEMVSLANQIHETQKALSSIAPTFSQFVA